jgi:hypothetical protein
MHFNNGFALRWISINRGRGSSPDKAAGQANAKNFPAVNFKEET